MKLYRMNYSGKKHVRKIIGLFLSVSLFCGCSFLNYFTGSGGQVGQGFVTGSISGFRFEFVSCTGNRQEGKVYLTFRYSHVLAPQEIAMAAGNNSYAVDRMGNRYESSPYNGQYKKTQAYTPEKVVIEIRGVPPSLNSFDLIFQSFTAYTIGVSDSRKETNLQFRYIPIDWSGGQGNE